MCFTGGGPACASHVDRGVAHGVRRPAKVLPDFELPPSLFTSSSYVYIFGKDLFPAGICLAREKRNTKNKDQTNAQLV